jgi:BioD-like phosphotransacetylase family protein
MRQVYLAATGMNRGKTTFALGLLAAMLEEGLPSGFIKPVGQRYALVDGIPADEDAILMRSVFEPPDPFEVMSPVHIPRGFTKAFIRGEVVEDLGAKIDAAYDRVIEGRDALLIEGTGHAGVGSVIGLSNADVAARLGAPAIIISEAGVGRPIDEIVLNHALFDRLGVPVVGAVVNKVDADAHPSLPEILRRGLARHGIELLGTLPYRPILSNPTLAMLVEQMEGKVLHEGADIDRAIEHVAIGAMQPRHVLERIGPGSLLIVPGDRQDVIAAALAANRTHQKLAREPSLFNRVRSRSRFGRSPADPATISLAGIILSGGYRPGQKELDTLAESGVFTFASEGGTYEIASAVHDLMVKTHPADGRKIEEIKRLVADHFDVGGLLERLRPLEGIPGRFAETADAIGRSERGLSAPGQLARRGLRGLARGSADLGDVIRSRGDRH